jgi:signal transduction histidine kinase
MTRGLARRLTLTLGLLLLGYGALVAVLVAQHDQEQAAERLQRHSHGLARHIAGHWPVLRSTDADDRQAREALLTMLMTVNPAIRVYLLDADGRVAHYIGEPGMVQTPRVALAPIEQFLRGAALPLRGTDPFGGPARLFSVAPLPDAGAVGRSPGYLYLLLEGPQAQALVAPGAPSWRSLGWALAAALLLTLALGALVVTRLTVPLQRLARRIQHFELPPPAAAVATVPAIPARAQAAGDELAALAAAFDQLSGRLGEQLHQREHQMAAHRELMANVAHDLRTPLTALHGHLEALRTPALAGAEHALPARLVAAALAQSDKVRRLTQQLFELATLQSIDAPPQHEPFRLDELVSDTVQKFDPGLPRPALTLLLACQGPVLLEGDLHLVERALSNLIDNAMRHAATAEPVRVRLECVDGEARVTVVDNGPGLPPELLRRLAAGEPVREPPLRRPGGGIGGLGLAIAQRVAELHGGRLLAAAAPGQGTRLELSLPLITPALQR